MNPEALKEIQDEHLWDNSDKEELNPAHYCFGNCGKYIGHRGFCSIECHNKYYDELCKEVEDVRKD